ncbi:MAG: hypothetical protein IIZ10_07805 [Solobacterium sp.]|nr:hypothetical protein [Solobacterium sp.]
MKQYLSRIFAVLILAILVSACAGGIERTVTDEPAAEPTAEPTHVAEMPEEAAELSLTLHSADAPEAEQIFHTSNHETVEAFHDLFEELGNAEDDSDAVSMKDDGFEAVMDGILACGTRSIAWLRDTLHWHKDAYENAVYLELREETDGNILLHTLILPEGSRFHSRLEALIEALQKEN